MACSSLFLLCGFWNEPYICPTGVVIFCGNKTGFAKAVKCYYSWRERSKCILTLVWLMPRLFSPGWSTEEEDMGKSKQEDCVSLCECALKSKLVPGFKRWMHAHTHTNHCWKECSHNFIGYIHSLALGMDPLNQVTGWLAQCCEHQIPANNWESTRSNGDCTGAWSLKGSLISGGRAGPLASGPSLTMLSPSGPLRGFLKHF